ncbi:hypothetical protein Sste5344_009189 [Sporothrix stenoceras]
MANRGDIANKMIRTEEGKWIDGFLSSSLRNTALGSSSKNKSRLYVGDLDLILHHHWVLDEERFAHERLHVQMAVILILAGATATRPGALIGNLSYKKVEFQVFPPASGSKRARVGMIVTLTKTKRTAGKSRPNKFGFHEENTLLRDPVLLGTGANPDSDAENSLFSGRLSTGGGVKPSGRLKGAVVRLTCPFCGRKARDSHKCGSNPSSSPVQCPNGYETCGGILGNFDQFVSHVRRQHSMHLSDM